MGVKPLGSQGPPRATQVPKLPVSGEPQIWPRLAAEALSTQDSDTPFRPPSPAGAPAAAPTLTPPGER